MPIAAVPKYLGQEFKDASPGLRFGMLLPIWTSRQDQEADVRKRAEAKSREGQEVADLLRTQGMDATIKVLRERRQKPLPGLWEKNDFAAKQAWHSIKCLTKSDQDRMKHLVLRQSTLGDTLTADQRLRLEATAIAPFTTGLGNEHPLENGFAFLWPYGLPYLPGSGVKGVLRQAAKELASGVWGDPQGWNEDKCYALIIGEEPIPLSVIDVLFGLESQEGAQQHVRGTLSFWDVIPQIPGDSLMVEIMTPHQSHYYQQTKERRSGDSVSPHDSGQPTPISFLTVPPGSTFTFFVVCDRQHLARLTQRPKAGAPDLLGQDEHGKPRWQTLLEAAFEHAFEWLGFGAKTAVGYGAMKRREPQTVGASPPVEHAAPAPPQPTSAPPSVSRQEERWANVTLTYQKGGGGVVTVTRPDGKKADAQGERAQTLIRSLSPELAKRLEKKGLIEGLTVLVTIEGNRRTVKAIVPDQSATAPTG